MSSSEYIRIEELKQGIASHELMIRSYHEEYKQEEKRLKSISPSGWRDKEKEITTRIKEEEKGIKLKEAAIKKLGGIIEKSKKSRKTLLTETQKIDEKKIKAQQKAIKEIEDDEAEVLEILESLKAKASLSSDIELANLNNGISELENLLANIQDSKITKQRALAKTESKAAMSFTHGFESLFDNYKILYKNYLEDIEALTKRKILTEQQIFNEKMNLGFLLFKDRIYTTFNVLLRTSEAYVKSVFKDFGNNLKDAFGPILKPIMFLIGSISLLTKSTLSMFKEGFLKNLFKPKSRIEPEVKDHYNIMEDATSKIISLLSEEKQARLDEIKRKAREQKPEEDKSENAALWLLVAGSIAFAIGAALGLLVKKIVWPFQLLYKGLDSITGLTDKGKKVFLGAMRGLDFLGDIFTNKVPAIATKTFTGIKSFLSSLNSLLGSAMELKGVKKVIDFFSPIGSLVKEMKPLGNSFVAVFDGIKLAVKGLLGYANKGIQFFKWIGSLFKGMGKIVTLATSLGRGFMAGFTKLFWPIQVIMSLFDFVSAFMKTEGSLGDKFKAGVWSVIDGLLSWPLKLVDMLLNIFKLKPEEGVLSYIKKAFDSIFSFDWIKSIIKSLPSMMVPDDVLSWANAPAAQKDAGINKVIDNKEKLMMTSKEEKQARRDQMQKLNEQASKTEKAINTSSSVTSMAIQNANSAGGSSDTPSYKIPTSQGTELWAAGQAALIV